MTVERFLILIFGFYAAKILLFWTPNENIGFKITFFDVGQGDAIQILLPNNEITLVDGGANYDIDYYISLKQPFINCSLNKLIPSHMDADHITGLTRLMQRCTFNTTLSNYYKCQTVTCNSLRQTLGTKSVRNIYKGYQHYYNNGGIFTLWPPKEALSVGSSSSNDMSAVLLVTYKDFEVLLTGDISSSIFSAIGAQEINKHISGRLDVLKVAHHGATSSLNKDVIKELKPKYCVISVGEGNRYGHPHSEVLGFLKSINCVILRTDKLGSIEFTVN